MTDKEKQAHDLAILYMQLQIKEGRISIEDPEDYQSFVNEYLDKYEKIAAWL